MMGHSVSKKFVDELPPGRRRNPKYYVLGRRCEGCDQPVLWIRRADKRRRDGLPSRLAIEPETWKGEAWYLRGKHQPHVRRCEKMRERLKRWKNRDLLV